MCPYYGGVLISEGGMYRLQWSRDLRCVPIRGVLISEKGFDVSFVTCAGFGPDE